jgi:hypothetical protein
MYIYIYNTVSLSVIYFSGCLPIALSLLSMETKIKSQLLATATNIGLQ